MLLVLAILGPWKNVTVGNDWTIYATENVASVGTVEVADEAVVVVEAEEDMAAGTTVGRVVAATTGNATLVGAAVEAGALAVGSTLVHPHLRAGQHVL